jgi:hypothetical protein
MIKLIKAYAASNNIDCKITELFVNNAHGVLIEFPWKGLPSDYFMEMLTPDGATASATGLGLMTVIKPFEAAK